MHTSVSFLAAIDDIGLSRWRNCTVCVQWQNVFMMVAVRDADS